MADVRGGRQWGGRACRGGRRPPAGGGRLRGLGGYLRDGGDRIRGGSVWGLARQYGLDVRLLSEFRRDHNLWSVLARYMVMERPCLLSAIRFRETPVDRVDLVAYWRDIVGEDSFVAGSLEEARRVWDVQRGAR